MPFSEAQAHAVGALMAATGSHDVVDAHLAVVAGASESTVLTSDEGDLLALAAHLTRSVRIVRI